MRIKLPKHLEFIRQLPCVICLARPVDPAHIRFADRSVAKPITGMGIKPDDMFVTPLCRRDHDLQHSGGELGQWIKWRLNPIEIAVRLFARSGDVEKGELIVLYFYERSRREKNQDADTN